MNRYAQSAEYLGPRGLLRPIGDQPESRFQSRVYSCTLDALHYPGVVPSWEESRRYWSAILEEDVRTNFARSRKKSEQLGFIDQFLSDNGIDPAQGRPSETVRRVVNGRTGESYEVVLPSLGSPFDIRHPNGMRYQYDGNGYLRVFFNAPS